MLTVHHLGKSQSERIVWLCEELGLSYEIKHYVRDPVTSLAPPELVALHPLGTAPVISDGDLLLAESGAIIEYINAKYGRGRLALGQDHPDYVDYIFWWHYANGNFQPNMGRNMLLRRLHPPPDDPIAARLNGRLVAAFALIEKRLGDVPFLAGENLSAADIMIFFSLTTMRYFMPVDLTPYPSILAYLLRIGGRDAYQRAMQKGDPGMPLLLT